MFMKPLLVLVVAVCAARAEDVHKTLDDTYDGTNASVEDLAGMLDCLSGTGPCSSLHASFRQHYPEVVIEACARCNPVQKRSICKLMKKCRDLLPDKYKVFRDKNDPKGIYFDNFLAALNGC